LGAVSNSLLSPTFKVAQFGERGLDRVRPFCGSETAGQILRRGGLQDGGNC
jgi:hypothetical protein